MIDSLRTIGRPQPGDRFGRYELIRLLGRGGMGETYAARVRDDASVSSLVALKVSFAHHGAIPPAQLHNHRQRFAREARALASINHPGVVLLRDMGEHNRVPYIALELVDGVSLKDVAFGANGRPPRRCSPAALVYVAFELLSAVDAAHRVGVLHRDITPSNVLIARTGDVKLADFGIANFLADETKLTESGYFLGTLGYAAPEVVRGGEAVGASDLYAIGVVVAELATNQRLDVGEATSNADEPSTHVRVLEALARVRPDLHPTLVQLVASLCAAEVRNRPRSAGEALDFAERALLPGAARFEIAELVSDLREAAPTG